MHRVTKHSNDPSGSPDGRQSQSYKITAALTAGLPLAFTPRVQSNATLAYSVIGAALVWAPGRFSRSDSTRSGQTFGFKWWCAAALHSDDGAVQVYLYWGYYWRPVYDHLWLLAAQVLFAFSLTCCCPGRANAITLGFGPIPIIFSTNLFMWFRDDWFYLQFLMIAVGFMGKDMCAGTGKGAMSISSIPLLCARCLFVAFDRDQYHQYYLGSGNRVHPDPGAQHLHVPVSDWPGGNVFLLHHLVAGMAAITLFSFNALLLGAGVPYFIDSDIPAAVFLGLHLLVTDRPLRPTPLGKLVFGMLYGMACLPSTRFWI